MTKKFKEYSGILVNNLQYERPAFETEIEKQVPQAYIPGFDTRKKVWNNYIDIRISRHKYWIARCVDCGAVHLIRADKIKNKQCKHEGDQR